MGSVVCLLSPESMKPSVHLWKHGLCLQVGSGGKQSRTMSVEAPGFGTKLPPRVSPPSGEFGESPKSAEPTFPPLSKRGPLGVKR